MDGIPGGFVSIRAYRAFTPSIRKTGAAVGVLAVCWSIPVVLADVQTTPIPASQSAVFYLLCRLIADESRNLAAAESAGQTPEQLQHMLDRNGLSRTDWQTVTNSVESVMRELERLAPERRAILVRSGGRPSPVDRNYLNELDNREKAALNQAKAALRLRLSSDGQRRLDVLLHELGKNVVGIRIEVK